LEGLIDTRIDFSEANKEKIKNHQEYFLKALDEIDLDDFNLAIKQAEKAEAESKSKEQE